MDGGGGGCRLRAHTEKGWRCGETKYRSGCLRGAPVRRRIAKESGGLVSRWISRLLLMIWIFTSKFITGAGNDECNDRLTKA